MNDFISERLSPPIELPTTQKKAIEIFGTTDNPFKASYVLADGSLLGSRNEEGVELNHAEITKKILPDSKRSESEFGDTGAIRMRKYKPIDDLPDIIDVFVEMSQNPNATQVRVLKELSTDIHKLTIDWFIPGVDRHSFAEYSEKHIHEEHTGPDSVKVLIFFLQKVRRSLAVGTAGSYANASKALDMTK